MKMLPALTLVFFTAWCWDSAALAENPPQCEEGKHIECTERKTGNETLPKKRLCKDLEIGGQIVEECTTTETVHTTISCKCVPDEVAPDPNQQPRIPQKLQPINT